MKRIIFPVLLLSIVFAFSSAIAQPKPYYGPLLFSMPRDTSVPPIYQGQSQQARNAYIWFDNLLHNKPESRIRTHLNAFPWGDTVKHIWGDAEKKIARNLYLIQDDNPLAYYMWPGNAKYTNPYRSDQEHVETFLRRAQIVGDSGITQLLLSVKIIADVVVDDTICIKDPDAYSAFDAVLVNSTIIDEIKGKQVPLCVGKDMQARRKFREPTAKNAGTIPCPTYPVRADTGTCLQFEYSPEWFRISHTDEGFGPQIGWWVKPNREYIVFLNFIGVGLDSTSQYFTISPGGFGNWGGMYPVVNGIVQDPNDDFHLGSSHLTPSEWKSRLRARINKIKNISFPNDLNYHAIKLPHSLSTL